MKQFFLCRQILLASRGVDPERLTKTLSSIDLKATFEPLEPIAETDLESYLKHEHELIILTAIEESKRDVRENFNVIC
jgi:nuclear pore complex protein Nup93